MAKKAEIESAVESVLTAAYQAELQEQAEYQAGLGEAFEYDYAMSQYMSLRRLEADREADRLRHQH